MVVIRLVAAVAILLVAAGVAGYFLTGNRRYLRFAWRIFIVAAGVVMIAVALLALERLAVTPLPL